MLGIYCRTSKSRPDKFTIENQKESGISCAKKLGLGFQFYVDDGISGTLDETIRGGLSDLFRDIKKGDITGVYCIDQSRIERDTRTWEFFVAICLNNNIKYYPGGSELDLDNITNRMYAQLMSVVNSYYAEITSKKVRLANALKAQDGKTHGMKPYGYKRNTKNEYEIDDEEGKHVARMFELSLAGNGAYTIANILNSEGVPTKYSKNFTGQIKRKDGYTHNTKYFDKKKVLWRGNVISDILKNPIYKGERIWKRHEDKIDFVDGKQVKDKFVTEVITATVPAIISSELWDRVQQNFAVNKLKVGRKDEYHYLLNGIIHCEKCGSEYRGKKRLKGRDNAYKCMGKRYPNSKCDSRGLSIPKLESFVIRYLFVDKSYKQYLLDLPEQESGESKVKPVLDAKQKELVSISRKIQNLVTLASDTDDMSGIAELQAQLSKLNQNRNQLKDTITLLEKKLSDESEYNSKEKIIKSMNSLTPSRKSSKIDAKFEEIKKLVHTLIEWISIKYIKESKGGSFEVKMKFKGRNESVLCKPDRNLTTWRVAYYFELKEYLDVLKDISFEQKLNFDIKKIVKNYEVKTLQAGSGKGYKDIVLDKDDLYNFD